MKRESFEGIIFEPCCGRGAISKVLEEFGYKVHASDIRDIEEIVGEKGKDVYLIKTASDNIVTNPPYSQLGKILEHLSKIYTRKRHFY
ncbi:MAG TPA: hypothetical protein VEF53_11200 [Patescibacteria group bacterium]|nr:hypothetical protein [Patescibacteria group bacterium]